jgi:hypothetical protein
MTVAPGQKAASVSPDRELEPDIQLNEPEE